MSRATPSEVIAAGSIDIDDYQNFIYKERNTTKYEVLAEYGSEWLREYVNALTYRCNFIADFVDLIHETQLAYPGNNELDMMGAMYEDTLRQYRAIRDRLAK